MPDKMKKFMVYAREEIYYQIPIEAKDADEAQILVEDGHYDERDREVVDSDGFSVTKVEKREG